ncbi:MAG: response regulator [Bacteroidales bacterium]|nr:response regulator [Bacteroidales bacterium]
MITSLLRNLPLKKKLSVVTVVTLTTLILIALSVVFFFRTFKVLNILTNAERIHMSYFQKGVSNFYKWKKNPLENDLDLALSQVDTANNMAYMFGKIDSLAAAQSLETFEKTLFNTLNEALHNDFSNAKLLANRSLIFIQLNDKRFFTAINTAYIGAMTGKQITETMRRMRADDDPELDRKLSALISKIEVEYQMFADDLDELGNYGQRMLMILMISLILLLALFIFIVSQRIAKAVSDPLVKMVEEFEIMAEGSIGREIFHDTKDETGKLVASFNKLQNSLSSVIESAKMVAKGNYETTIIPQSDKDELSRALSQMTKALADNTQKQLALDWLKTGKNKLNESLRGDLSLEEIAVKTLSFLAAYLPAEWGSFYVYDEENNLLKLHGNFGTKKKDSLPETIAPGEHLTGQSFDTGKQLLLENLEPERVVIVSSLLQISAKSMLILPLIHDGKVTGVLELASIQQMSEAAHKLATEASESIAIAIKSAISRRKTKELLNRTQQQAEELQSQQEELLVVNEELEEQAQALKENERSLQVQQEELRVTNEELEERTQDQELQKNAISDKNKALELAQKSIQIKAEELETISRYKSEFLANMSHELRTPLNSLLILSRDLAENKKLNLNKDQVESASIIYQSGQDLLNLINDILDLSKIESGKMTITPEVVQIIELEQYIRNNFRHMAEEKGLKFDVITEKGLPSYIITDKHRLGQVIKNLVSNALKFTHKGQVIIRFKNTEGIAMRNPSLKKTNTIMLAVEGSGIGIPIDKQNEIFEAFHQADGSISRKYGGTGLGLSITRELTKLLGGEIHLASEPGKGSVFMIVLPFETPSEPSSENQLQIIDQIFEQAEQVEQETQKTAAKPLQDYRNDEESMFLPDDRNNIQAGDKSLLIVEDDSGFAKILIRLSRERGFKCIAAETGEQALLLAEKYKPDAIILDIMLPGMNGYKVLEILKQDAHTRHIPVHIMSATEGNSEALQKGAIGFLSKPAEPEALDMAFKKIEGFVKKNIKDLLIVEDDHNMRHLIRKIVGGEDISVTEAKSGKEALRMIEEKEFDCMVLDLGLPDLNGFELLRKMQLLNKENLPPVIVYTGRDLSKEENAELQKYSSSIIIKGVKSEERLLDETALFLHRVVDNLPESKKEMINVLYDKEAVFKNKSILIADDDMRNIFALTRILEDRGINVFEAENGLVALEKLKQNPQVDLILMDIMMPEMDGYTAIKEIRKQPQWEKLPIITLTAKAMKEDRQKSLAAGASDYLTKPVDIPKLLSLLRVWLYK